MQPINSHQRKIILIGLGLLLLVILTYLPVRNNVFIFFDDPGYVMGNPHVQSGVTWGNVKWAMTSTVGGNWHPLTWVSHMLDCQWFGLNPRWHHLTSLLLHAVNTVLVFLVLEGMTGAVWQSFFVAAMFGVHPLHVESVAWVSERKDVLSTLFWMLTLWAYARYVTEGKRTSYIELPMRETADHASCDMQHEEKSGVQGPKSKVWYGCALVTFALGLMCKPMLVTLPFVLLLLDFWPLNRFPQKNLMKLAVEKAPFFLLSIAICVITIPAQKGAGAVRTMANFPLMVRLENVPVSYCRYLGKLFWPANLPFFYPYPVHWPPVAVLGATLLLLCLLICAWMTRRDHPYFLMGWCWFVGILVPVIGLVQVGFQSIANRYTYVPSIGIFLALSWGVPALIRHWRHQFFVLFTLATTAILVCIPVTRIQIGYWKDSVTLFQYASVVIKNNWGVFIGKDCGMKPSASIGRI
jgi:hypothetical protein